MALKDQQNIQRDSDGEKLITDEFVKWVANKLKINLNSAEVDNLIVEHDFP